MRSRRSFTMTFRNRYDASFEARCSRTRQASRKSPISLDRRLEAYGLSFQDLVDEGRYEIARQALLDTDMNIVHVAALLDYAGASSFVRAFRRWCGLTPMQWRKQHQATERRLDALKAASGATRKGDKA